MSASDVDSIIDAAEITPLKPEDLRIAVCIPSYESWRMGFGHSVLSMVAHFAASPYAGASRKSSRSSSPAR